MTILEYGRPHRTQQTRSRWLLLFAIVGCCLGVLIVCLRRQSRTPAPTPARVVVRPMTVPTTGDVMAGLFLITKEFNQGGQPVFVCPSANASTQPE